MGPKKDQARLLLSVAMASSKERIERVLGDSLRLLLERKKLTECIDQQ